MYPATITKRSADNKRPTWLDKVTMTEVVGLTYADCAAMQERTGFEGEEYEAQRKQMIAVAVEMGIANASGTLCRLHALITATALSVIAKRVEFGS